MQMNEPYFDDRDRALVEALTYDPAEQPAYEYIKGCLVWRDERPDGMTPMGYERLCDLWIARSYLHRGMPLNSGPFDPDYFEKAWKHALRDGIHWPGFRRLTLSPEDKAYYELQLNDTSEW
jgi:hypothetical protein